MHDISPQERKAVFNTDNAQRRRDILNASKTLPWYCMTAYKELLKACTSLQVFFFTLQVLLLEEQLACDFLGIVHWCRVSIHNEYVLICTTSEYNCCTSVYRIFWICPEGGTWGAWNSPPNLISHSKYNPNYPKVWLAFSQRLSGCDISFAVQRIMGQNSMLVFIFPNVTTFSRISGILHRHTTKYFFWHTK